MATYIFMFFLGIVNVVSFFAIFVLLITNISYFIIPLMVYLITCIIVYTLFCNKTNKYPLNDFSEYFVPKMRRCFTKDGDGMKICFTKINGIWVCENNEKTIKLDLSGYLFQKSYIKSFVIRNLRYSIISGKKPYTHLFRNKYFVRKDLNLTLILIDGKKVFNIRLVENGVSRYGFIAKQITKSPFRHLNLLREAEEGSLTKIVHENDYSVSKKGLRQRLRESKELQRKNK